MNRNNKGRQVTSVGETINLELDYKLKGVYSSEEITKAKMELIENYEFNELIYCSKFMVKCHSYVVEKNSLIVIQDYYQKKLQNIKIGCLPYLDKICIITKIARIIQYTVNKRICIRSLRPQMLAITKYADDIDVKLIWLDKAKILDEGQSKIRYYYGGTFMKYLDITSFTPPEIQAGKLHDTRADVWSFGALFYYLMFGNTKLIRFSGDRLTVGYPEGTPAWLIEILENFLHQDPQMRPKIEVAFDYLKAMKICSQTAEKTLPKCSF